MKRRDFLKRAVGVIAGTMVAPTVVKAKTKSISVGGCSSSPSISLASLEPEYPLGTRRVDADGRVFRYCQVKQKGVIMRNDQIVGVSTGDGWMQTYGICCDVPTITGKELVHLNISV